MDLSGLLARCKEAETKHRRPPQAFLKILTRTIRGLAEQLRIAAPAPDSSSPPLKLSQKQRKQNQLHLLESFRVRLGRLPRGGGGGGGNDGGGGGGVGIGVGRPRLQQRQRQQQQRMQSVKWTNLISAFRGRMQTSLVVNLTHIDPRAFLKACQALFVRKIGELSSRRSYSTLKVNAIMCGNFVINSHNELKEELKYINTRNVVIEQTTNLRSWFKKHIAEYILAELEEFQERDSGWALAQILNLAININRFSPLGGGSSYIKLPPYIEKKHACINIKNRRDDLCFMYCIIAACYENELGSLNNLTVSKAAPYLDKFTYLDFVFPLQISQVAKFEKVLQFLLRQHAKKTPG